MNRTEAITHLKWQWGRYQAVCKRMAELTFTQNELHKEATALLQDLITATNAVLAKYPLPPNDPPKGA